MSHTYTSHYPSGAHVDPEIMVFFEKFYELSDTPNAHDHYVQQFTDDASFTLASKRVVGRDEILKLRTRMWSAVTSRKHTIPKVFPFGGDSNLFMLYGTVDLVLKNGNQTTIEWAGRAQLTKCTKDGRYKFEDYQVYLDTGATDAYKK